MRGGEKLLHGLGSHVTQTEKKFGGRAEGGGVGDRRRTAARIILSDEFVNSIGCFEGVESGWQWIVEVFVLLISPGI